MSPNVPKLALDCIQMVWIELQKNEKIAQLDGPFLGIFGSNFSYFENFGPENDQSVFEEKSLLLSG